MARPWCTARSRAIEAELPRRTDSADAVVGAARAIALLRDSEASIDQIAERLGFSARAAFERAFVRWSGKTPHAVRCESA